MLELKAKIGTRGQVVIPKPIRDLYQMRAGEEVFFGISGGEITVRKENGREVLERMLNRVPDKQKEPKYIDWDEEYYSQFEE